MEGLAEYLGTHRLARRPADARLYAAKPRGSARVGTHPHHPGRRGRSAGQCVFRRSSATCRRPTSRERALCLVLGRRRRCWTAIPAIETASASSIGHVREPRFQRPVLPALRSPIGEELCEEWQLMVTDMEYGYDVAALGGRFHARQVPLPPAGERAKYRGRRPRLAEQRPAAGSGPAIIA